MNSKDDDIIPPLYDLIKFFQVKSVFAKPKICSRECSPPKDEGSSGVHINRARGGERVGRDRGTDRTDSGSGNQPASSERTRGNGQGSLRISDHAGRVRVSEQAGTTRSSEQANGAKVNVGSSRDNENVGRIKLSKNVDQAKNKENGRSNESVGAGKARGNQNVDIAKSAQIVDRAGGGDVSRADNVSQPKNADNNNVTVSDRGKTGAGVTGSRKGQIREENIIKSKSQDDLLGPIEQSTKPGLLRHIHNASRYRIPQCFEGAVVSVKQGAANSNWIIGHSMSFSSVSPGGYKILLSYAERDKSDAVPYFVMEAAPGGQMSCELRVSPTNKTRASVVAQIADKQLHSFETIFDVYFKSSTASIIAVNKEFIALHYLKSITERFSLGAEVVARGSDRALSSASAAARWCDDDNSLSATIGDRGLDVCYAKNIKPYLTVASMLEIGFGIQRAVATLAYEWHTQDWTVRGSVDSDGLVGATLHRGLGGKRAQLACAISALLNHPNDKFKLGFGITAAID